MDAGYCFFIYTPNRKCHISSVNITKHFNRTSETTRPRGQAGRGRGHNCHEAEASFFGPRGRGRDEDVKSSSRPNVIHPPSLRNKLFIKHLGLSKIYRPIIPSADNVERLTNGHNLTHDKAASTIHSKIYIGHSPPTHSSFTYSLKITNHSFLHDAPHLWNKHHSTVRVPYQSGTSSSLLSRSDHGPVVDLSHDVFHSSLPRPSSPQSLPLQSHLFLPQPDFLEINYTACLTVSHWRKCYC